MFTNIDYTYTIMEKNIFALKARYPFLEVGTAGKSVFGKNLYYIKLGNGPNKVFYNASHHGTEWVTSTVVMKFIERFCSAYTQNKNLRGFNVKDIFKRSSIYIMPMVNPDGVDLVLGDMAPDNPYYQWALRLNKTGQPLRLVWKANIRGVDLNVNYPAIWDREKQDELKLGITGPAPQDFGGSSPLSEPETIAVANFTKMHDFRLVLAYHTQGRVIFWQFQNLAPPEAFEIAQQFSSISGYSVELNPPEASYAGYKDWFIQEYRRPGFTIEAGYGINAVPITQFDAIYNENEGIMLLAAIV